MDLLAGLINKTVPLRVYDMWKRRIFYRASRSLNQKLAQTLRIKMMLSARKVTFLFVNAESEVLNMVLEKLYLLVHQ